MAYSLTRPTAAAGLAAVLGMFTFLACGQSTVQPSSRKPATPKTEQPSPEAEKTQAPETHGSPAPRQTSAPKEEITPPVRVAPFSPTAARKLAWACLNEGLADKNEDRRAAAITAVATIGLRPEVLRSVESGLEDKSATVRLAAIQALGDMKARSAIPKLRIALDDNSPVVTFAAAQVLFGLGDKSSAPVFAGVIAGERKVSAGMIQTQWHNMQQKLHDPVGLAEFGAAQAAGAFLGPAAFGFGPIMDATKDKMAWARALSARMLGRDSSQESRDALYEALLDKSPLVKAAAAAALGHAGTLTSAEDLMPLLDDPHREVRYSAAASIVRLTMLRTTDREEPQNKPVETTARGKILKGD